MTHRIGIIGAGAIVRSGHLPAYKAAGLQVVAIADSNIKAAEIAAAEFGVPRIFSSAEDLILHGDADVVDIAVPPMDQPRIARLALDAGNHVLCQKPLSWTLEEAVALVAYAKRANRQLAVNQQFRWAPVMIHLDALLRGGALGTPELITFDITTFTDWATWDWLVNQPRLDLLAHSIHYLDGLRALFGEPKLVTTVGRKSRGQRAGGESVTITTLDFGGPAAVLTVTHNVPFAEFSRGELRVFGTEGAYEGRLGLYSGPNFAWREPDQARWSSKGEDNPLRALPGLWMPDAFAGPMLGLLSAIDGGVVAPTGGDDNLKTLAIVFAGYRSMETGLPVSPAQVLAEARDKVRKTA